MAYKQGRVAQDGLSVDILHRIFTQAHDSTPLEAFNSEGFPSWLSPLHVCRTWRAASLTCASLWRHVPLQSLALTDFALSHAKSLPLIVYAPPAGHFESAAVRTALLLRPTRIQQLACLATTATSKALKTLSALEVLCLWIPSTQSGVAEDRDILRGQLTAIGLGGAKVLGPLRELRLHAVESGLYLTPGVLQHTIMLTVLELTLDGRIWDNLSSFFHSLRALSKLQSLVIRNGVLPHGFSEDPYTPEPHGIIELAHLRELCLEADTVVVARILQWLSMPTCTRVALTMLEQDEDNFEPEPEQDSDGEDIEYLDAPVWLIRGSVIDILVSHFKDRQADRFPLQHLSLHSMDDDFHRNTWYSPSDLASCLRNFPHLVTLSIIFHDQPRDRWEATAEEPIALSELTHLHLSGMSEWLFPVARAIAAPKLLHRSLVLQTSPPGSWYDSSRYDYSKSKSATKNERFPETHLRQLREAICLPKLSNDSSDSYTRLYITPLRTTNYLPGLRLLATGVTGPNLPPVLDLSLDEQNLKHGDFNTWDYAAVLGRILAFIPLTSLHELHVAHPSAKDGLLTDTVLASLRSARVLDVRYYTATGPLLALPNLQYISLKHLPAITELPSTSPSQAICLDITGCTITEADIDLKRKWAGSENFTWDGITKRKRAPTWAMNSPAAMRNGITVHDLPPELLLEAFQHLVELKPLGTIDYPEEWDDASDAYDSTTTSSDDDYSNDEHSSSSQSIWHPFSLAWMRVTHVCSRWRYAALSAPSLWSFIPLNLPRAWVDELFRRTQTAPVDIYIPEDHWGDRLTTRMYNMIGKDHPATSGHILDELSITTYLFPRLDLTAFKHLRRLDVDFRSNIVGLGALSILTDVNIPSLTELRLVMTRPYADTSVTLPGHWTAVLDKLTVLELESVQFDFTLGHEEIVLPRLRELRITENAGFCGNFVRHVRVPYLSSYAVRYDCPEYGPSIDLREVKALGFARVLDDVDATIPPLHALVVIHILTSYSALFHVHGWRSNNHDGHDTEDFPLQVMRMAPIDAHISHNMDLPNDTGMIMMANFATTLLSHPSLSTLCMLSLDYQSRTGTW
ncbi:unnamed protein product [Peniophora sp. CBMAI 1063]|nr:unnamed protein product [Peniophora sp. CBMAI 1063]